MKLAREDAKKKEQPADSGKPSENLTLGVDGSSMPKSGQSKVATLGDKMMQSADEDLLNRGDPRLAEELEEDDDVEATCEWKQPDVESTKAKRSFYQSFGELDPSPKKTKRNGNWG